MTELEAIAATGDRADGRCECIGGGCPAPTHRPGVNRCFQSLRDGASVHYMAIDRLADTTNMDNLLALCEVCAQGTSGRGYRVG